MRAATVIISAKSDRKKAFQLTDPLLPPIRTKSVCNLEISKQNRITEKIFTLQQQKKVNSPGFTTVISISFFSPPSRLFTELN